MSQIILITGGSASGKTTLAETLAKESKNTSLVISMDSFYKSTASPIANYDLPSAFDWDAFKNFIDNIKNNKVAMLPIYDFTKHKVIGHTKVIPKENLIIEGLFTFYDNEICSQADFKIFVDTPSDIRLGRRIKRDTKERGRDIDSIIQRWNDDVQPSYEKYINRMKRKADIIIPWSSINKRSTWTLTIALKNLKDINS